MNILKSTNAHKKYWKERKIDWKKSYSDTWNHPHRDLLVEVLKTFSWISLIEIGCGSGPNLINIVKKLPGRQVGGVDINEDAVELAQQTFRNGIFKVNSADDIMLSDNSTDVMLSDMTLIYVSPRQIDKYVKELKRLARNYIVLCEFHSTSRWNRMALKWNTGYNAYNWVKLLEKHGMYDIQAIKIPEELWPGGDPQKTFGYIIVAKLPKYV